MNLDPRSLSKAEAAAQPQVPFALPDIGDDEIAAVVECLRSGWITTGKQALAFERDFSECHYDEKKRAQPAKELMRP